MYITQQLDIDQLYNIAINDSGEEYDTLTHLRSRTFYGRPDFKAIYTRIRGAIETGAFLGPRESGMISHIGVCFISLIMAPYLTQHFMAVQTYFCGVCWARKFFVYLSHCDLPFSGQFIAFAVGQDRPRECHRLQHSYRKIHLHQGNSLGVDLLFPT
jgi:hypothetical protein